MVGKIARISLKTNHLYLSKVGFLFQLTWYKMTRRQHETKTFLFNKSVYSQGVSRITMKQFLGGRNQSF
jgi:hypothetical protein